MLGPSGSDADVGHFRLSQYMLRRDDDPFSSTQERRRIALSYVT